MIDWYWHLIVSLPSIQETSIVSIRVACRVNPPIILAKKLKPVLLGVENFRVDEILGIGNI